MELQKDRVDKFNKALSDLLKDHHFSLGSEALIHEGLVKTKVVIIDTKKQDAREADKKEESTKQE